jgi:hypothetical protein
MADTTQLIAAAQRLREKKDEEALAFEIGVRSKRIEADPGAADNPNLVVIYGAHLGMGAIDDIKALGWRILGRWNKEVYGVVCSSQKAEDQEMRKKILGALSLDEAALIAVIAPTLIWLGAPAAIAAPVAPLLVKKFIIPAKEELCVAWGEAITAQG